MKIKKIILTLLFLLSFMICFCFSISSKRVFQKMDIQAFCCADDNNLLETQVAIFSMLENSEERFNINIVCFKSNPITQENILKTKKLEKKFKNLKLNFVSFDESKLKKINTEPWHKSILVKLYCAEIFPDLEKIFWFDDDVLFLQNINELWKKNLDNKYLATVDLSEMANKYAVSKPKCDYWLTAGIGLYNLKEIRKDKLQEKFLKKALEFNVKKDDLYARKQLAGGVEEYALTQSIVKNKALLLPYKYCIFVNLDNEGKLHYKNEKHSIDNCVSLHFSGPHKPWKTKKGIRKSFYDIWQNYYNMTKQIVSTQNLTFLNQ
ncbi:MAG: glycosyltransferase family 8 protein [Candidatus Improbicoccus devescovinae]|nr:MAG: glycosyltransferase family 8 protein [Candidatus Improbicoccus devescovinae]